MIARFIEFFVDRHLLTNLAFILVIVGGVIAWQDIKKEERPDYTSDFVRVSASYPGATAEEVEHFITRELENELKGVDGIERITSSTSRGSTTVTVELQRNLSNKDEVITEIRNTVLGASLPPEIRDKPTVRVFKSSKKAIIDIALVDTTTHLLNNEKRNALQRMATALELQLINLPHINSVSRSGFLQPELQINVDPQKLVRYQIPLSQVSQEISRNHIRRPAGSLDVKDEPNVTINAQLDTVEKLNKLYIQAGFQGKAIQLSDIAEVRSDFRRIKEIIKVNGHEAIMFNVVKNSAYGILESLESVQKIVDEFKANNLLHSDIQLVILDDESYDVRNRLSIISVNGAIGFVLILLTLFIFLDMRSGLWVAMGIPFTVCLTLICTLLLGYTVNNITLAAVIIVMGIVVDDAIVVAENVSRYRAQGLASREASVRGTAQVFMPVLASIVTTCVAFVPLFYFSGHFGSFVSFIPPIVFLMLFASLLEALVILPGHLDLRFPFSRTRTPSVSPKQSWFDSIEHLYGTMLIHVLRFKYIIFVLFGLLLFASWKVADENLKFVMFPNTETREIVLIGSADKTADRYDTAKISKQIEELIRPYIGKEVVGLRTEIARSRRGGAAVENQFRMIVEIVPKEERKRSANELVALWQPEVEKIEGLKKIVIQKSRWGQSSGSALEVTILESDDTLRKKAAQTLLAAMQNHPDLNNAEIDQPPELPEYKVNILREKAKRLGINPLDISSTFHASLEGDVLYELPHGTEQIDVRLSVQEESKQNINSILDIPVENRANYLAPLKDLVEINPTRAPVSITRMDSRRATSVVADLKSDATKTPLEIAVDLEEGVFREIVSSQPTTSLAFDGEVADTRESRNDFQNAIITVLFLIFAILAILFNSISRPLLIMLAIPFGMVGVVFAFWMHGQTLFGFFAAVGSLGMTGVVINDAIIMLSKLEAEFSAQNKNSVYEGIARIAQTRLKAVILTTLTTVAGVLPTAYGFAGFDAMLSEMMLALAWGLVFGTVITLILVPCMYATLIRWSLLFRAQKG
ncbi:MAG: efflux RND transporter permease subunit [Gammaproteobacteria bacterium]|nr:efflux RND transporter permease subunit [Gammaproteobacteria bacterium]MDH5694283.1 efflux RND transporter permease subunit [Gammaproteobacteria bacterium]